MAGTMIERARAHVTVKGTVKKSGFPGFIGKPFGFEADAVLSELGKDDGFHYGTGCWLHIDFLDDHRAPVNVDCRYEGTRDIETLIRRWIGFQYGENADEITITVE